MNIVGTQHQLPLFYSPPEVPETVVAVFFDGPGLVTGKGPIVAIFGDVAAARCLLNADVGFHWLYVQMRDVFQIAAGRRKAVCA